MAQMGSNTKKGSYDFAGMRSDIDGCADSGFSDSSENQSVTSNSRVEIDAERERDEDLNLNLTSAEEPEAEQTRGGAGARVAAGSACQNGTAAGTGCGAGSAAADKHAAAAARLEGAEPYNLNTGNKDGKCPICNEVVKDTGMQCEICSDWYHYKCIGMDDEKYQYMQNMFSFHWFCKGCDKGVSKVLNAIVQVKSDVKELQDTVKNLAQSVTSMETKMDTAIKASLLEKSDMNKEGIKEDYINTSVGHIGEPRSQMESPSDVVTDRSSLKILQAMDPKKWSAVVTDMQLMRVAELMGSRRWKFLGIKLGIPGTDIDAVHYDQLHQGIAEVIYAVLARWREREGTKATVQCLVEALASIDLVAVAEKAFKE